MLHLVAGLATTLLSVGCCGSIGMSCNLGAKLDSVGKAVPVAHSTGQFLLDDKLYHECEIVYNNFQTPVIELKFGHLRYLAAHTPLPPGTPAPPTARYLLCRKNNEVISAADFDYSRATCTAKPKHIGHGLPARYCTDFHPLSADYNKELWETQVNFLPEQRTLGNYLRTPLVAAVSWGVDVPLSLAGNAILYTLSGIAFLVDSAL